MICHKVLNLTSSDLIPDTTKVFRPWHNKSFSVRSQDPKLFLGANVYEKLSELGDLTSLVFHMKPYADKQNVHIDISSKSKLPFWPSLNVLIEGQGVMRWFVPNSQGNLSYQPNADVWYQSWENTFGEVVDQWSEGKVALVKTDVAHNVWNPGDTDRLAVSIRWRQRYSWEETLEWFEKNFYK